MNDEKSPMYPLRRQRTNFSVTFHFHFLVNTRDSNFFHLVLFLLLSLTSHY